MKNKRGFTLIELLAVIVILAIIALIAAPIVLNTIEKSRKNAAKDSMYGYVEAIESQNALAQLNSEKYQEVTTGDVTSINSKLKLKGSKPTSGNVTIEKGQVTQASICVNGYTVTYDGKEASVGEKCNESEPAPVVLAPGLYDANDNLIESYDDLVSKTGFNPSIEEDDNHQFRFSKRNGVWYWVDEEYGEVEISNSDYFKGMPFYVLSKDEYSNVKKVVLPDSVTSIGERAFQYSKITSITISNSVTSIGSNAFRGTKLTTITIPSSVTEIGAFAFYDIDLTSITIPASVTSIGSDAFYGIKVLYYEGTAEDTRSNNWGALALNPYIEGDLVYSDNAKATLLAYIGNSSSVTIPNSVTSIGESAFYDNQNLTSVTFESGSRLTSIGEWAFGPPLKSITIPNSVTSIGEWAFSGIKVLNYTGTAEDYHNWGALALNPYIEREFAYSDNTKTTLLAYIGNSSSVTIPNSVTSIGSAAFQYDKNLKNVVFESGSQLEKIMPYAFSETGITSITIPSSVTSIGDAAFRGINTVHYNGTATGSPWGATQVVSD